MIEAKIAGQQVISVPEEEAPVVDIMTALKESIERTKVQKKPMEKAKGAKKEVAEIEPAKQRKQKVA
jgi:non-homologous end joining protein Ku